MIQPENERFFNDDRWSLIKEDHEGGILSTAIDTSEIEYTNVYAPNNMEYERGFYGVNTIEEALDKYDEYIEFAQDRYFFFSNLIMSLEIDKRELKKWAETPHTEEELLELY